MRFSAPRIPLLLLALAALAGRARAEAISEERIERLFRPLLGERLAMSTDGRYVAYTQHVKDELLIVVYDLERRKESTRIAADEDRPILFSKEKQPAKLRFLEWANGNRLVFAPTIERISPPSAGPFPEFAALMSGSGVELPQVALRSKVIAPVMAVDADGTHPRELFDAKDIDNVVPGGSLQSVVPNLRGFGTGDERAQLVVEIVGGAAGNSTQLFHVNVQTGALKRVHAEAGTGRFFYDWQDRPLLNQLPQERNGLRPLFYRPLGGKRWMKMPDAPGPQTGVHFTVTPETYFGERAIPLGFGVEPNVLIYASNAGRDTFGVYGMDLATGQRTARALEHPTRDLAALDASLTSSSSLVFDKFRRTFVGVRAASGPRPLTLWLDPQLGAMQAAVEKKFPDREVHLEDWNEARTRFLVRTAGGAEPSSLLLLRAPEGSMTELTRGAPWLAAGELHETKFIEFPGPDGSTLTGYLTLPRTPRLNPPPVILWFASGLPPVPHRAFDPQAQVFADMGFVVCRLNQRGVLGMGARSRDALRRDPDGVPAADALAAIEWLAAHQRVDRKRIATFGEGFAGYFAVRVTELHPEIFRCAVAFDPIFNFSSWVRPLPNDPPGEPSSGQRATPLISGGPPSFQQEVNRLYFEGSGTKLDHLSLAEGDGGVSVPVFVAAHEVRDAVDQSAAAGVSRLKSALSRRDIPCVTMNFNEDFAQGGPVARARVYRALEEFFNLNLYNYDVKIGPTRVVK